MKTKLLFTITGILLMVFFQVFGSNTGETGMQSETQTAGGSVLTVMVHSESIANNMIGDVAERKVSVYLPPGYDDNSNVNYPVVYMLPGKYGTNEDWYAVMGGPAFTETLNKAIETGKIKPMILVFADGKNKLANSWYTNSAVAGNWEDFIVSDLVNYIDENFRTVPFPPARGIAGRNIGGYGALKLATKYPDIFGLVYAMNAFVDFETVINDENIWANSFKEANNATSYPTSDAFANQLLGMAVSFSPNENNPASFGTLPKNADGEINSDVSQQWLNQDPLYMMESYVDNLKKLKAITIDCSTADVKIMLNSNYSEALNENNIEHSFLHFNGTDNATLASRVNDVMLPMFSDNLCHSLLLCDVKPVHIYTDTLKARLITDGNIYIVPDGAETNGSLTKSADNTIHVTTKANEIVDIPLNTLKKGVYTIYAVCQKGFVGNAVKFGLNGGIPQVKIYVTDSRTGLPLECSINVNDIIYSTDTNVEFSWELEKPVNLTLSKEGYGTLEKSFTIYTDTVINISMVKDSRIQVIEKGYGMPVFEATVTQNLRATLTGRDGYTTVQNLTDGILDCRIFKEGYHTKVVHTELLPGKTKIIELTKKQAKIDFYLVSENGPAEGVPVLLGDVQLLTDNTGKASFTGFDTRENYTYSVNSKFFGNESGSFYLQADTVISLFLTTNENALEPVTDGTPKSDQLLSDIGQFDEIEILVYPNPAHDEVTVKTDGTNGLTVQLLTQSGSVLYTSKIEGTLHRINLSNLSNGVYFMTVKSDNYNHTQRIMKL